MSGLYVPAVLRAQRAFGKGILGSGIGGGHTYPFRGFNSGLNVYPTSGRFGRFTSISSLGGGAALIIALLPIGLALSQLKGDAVIPLYYDYFDTIYITRSPS